MGEIFKREKAAAPLAFSGERLTGAVDGQIEIEHYHRYFLARGMARGLDVLEVAAGEGYGAALLAQVARQVTAVEIDAESVAHARASYARDNLRYIEGDARAIPLPDAAFDLAVSFETIEHFYEQERFLDEVRRVLRPEGVFIVSTPDRDIYSTVNSPANRHHVRELTAAEFIAALKARFAFVEVLAQRPMIGSALLPIEASEPAAIAPSLSFERRGDGHFEACAQLPRALYLVAIASDRPVILPRASLYIESSQLAEREAQWAQMIARGEASRQALEATLAQTRAQLAQTRAEVERRGARIHAVTTEFDAAQQTIGHARRDIDELRRQVDAFRSSTSWKLTAPLRLAMRLLRPPRVQPAPTPPAYAPAAAPPVMAAAAEPIYGAPLGEADRRRQREALGLDLPPPRLALTIGIVTYNTEPEGLARAVRSAQLALARAGGEGRVLLVDNGAPSEPLDGTEKLPGQGNLGFGRGHNLLMQAAFAAGADVYVAMNPDGALHPGALARIARLITVHAGRALVEAMQFPAEHPKAFDPITGETAWASGACMAIPRAVFEATGGFDDAFFMYCEDVDLSWRVRAMGMKVLIAPHALFLHAVTNRESIAAMRQAMLTSAVLLGQKWHQPDFTAAAVQELSALGAPIPAATPEPVPPAWRGIPDFSRHFSFSPVRW